MMTGRHCLEVDGLLMLLQHVHVVQPVQLVQPVILVQLVQLVPVEAISLHVAQSCGGF